MEQIIQGEGAMDSRSTIQMTEWQFFCTEDGHEPEGKGGEWARSWGRII